MTSYSNSMYVGMFIRHTYLRRYVRWLVISAPAEAGLALGVFTLPPISSFLRQFQSTRHMYLPYYIVNISTCTYVRSDPHISTGYEPGLALFRYRKHT